MLDDERPSPSEEMILSSDSRSLRRGRRAAPRTPTCRACLVWPQDAPEIELKGVVLNLTPHGLLIRMLEPLGMGTPIKVQMMRDEDYREPLSRVLEGGVVRVEARAGGFIDHGIKLDQKPIVKPESRPVQYRPSQDRPPQRTRMHTIDFHVGGGPTRRLGGK